MNDHIPLPRLHAFRQGASLSESDASSFAEHLAECPSCQQAFDSLGASPARQFFSTLHGREDATSIAGKSGPELTAPAQPVADSSFAAKGGPTIRGYRLLEKLGEGGMGAVYKAQHIRLKRLAALKVLPLGVHSSQGIIARFEREMEAVGALDHPNIVRAFDAGEQDGQHFLAMEFVAGCDLGQLSHLHGPLPMPIACEMIRQAALGLQHAHDAGLIHRDIKPSNLMLSYAGGVKILDLGLALLSSAEINSELTSSGQIMGTFDYMAPEQGDDPHLVDLRADVYSLGATLYKLLTGVAPFGDPHFSTPAKKLMALAKRDPLPIQQRCPELPAGLSAVVARMLARDPARRYSSVAAAAEALAPFAAGANLTQWAASIPQLLDERGGRSTLKPRLVETVAPTVQFPAQNRSPEQSAERLSGFARRVRMFLAIGIVLVAVVGGVMLWRTSAGVVSIEILDDKIQATFDKDGLTLTGADRKTIKVRPIASARPERAGDSVSPGTHRLLIERGDFRFETQSFELQQHGKTTIRISVVEDRLLAEANGRSIGEKPLINSKPAEAAAPIASDLLKNSVNLLGLVDPQRDAVSGRWQIRSGKLFAGGNAPEDPLQERLQVGYSPPKEYDMRLLVERMPLASEENQTAQRAFVLMFPRPSPFQLVLDYGSNESETTANGLQQIEGSGFDSNETTFRGHPFRANGRPVLIECQVRSKSIQVFIEGEPRINWQGDTTRFASHAAWALPRKDQPGLGVQNGGYCIHEWTLTPLNPSKMGSSHPADAIAETIAFAPVSAELKERMQAMPPATVTGKWTIDKDELISEGLDRQWDVCVFGDPNWKDYNFRAEVLDEDQGQRSHKIQENPVLFLADGKAENFWKLDLGAFSSTRNIDLLPCVAGEDRWHNPGRRFVHGGIHGKVGTWYLVEVQVRQGTVAVTIDGDMVLKTEHPNLVMGRVGAGRIGRGKSHWRNFQVKSPEGELLWQGLPELPPSD